MESNKKYIITHIKTTEKSFLSFLNVRGEQGTNVVLNIKKSIYLFSIKIYTVHRIARGFLLKGVDISNYIKVGDVINLKDYPMLKISKT
jgi:hypothetical protein